MSNWNAKADFTDTDFIGNKAIAGETQLAGNGGAVYSSGGNTEFTGGNFKGNEANKMGGAVYLAGNGDGSFTGVTFEGNKAQGAGGAVVVNGGNVTIEGSTFSNNTAVKADSGALYIVSREDNKVTVKDSTFTGNSAGTNGGAIGNSGVLELSGKNTFSGNTAGGVANDIYSTGTITVLGGTTTMGSGVEIATQNKAFGFNVQGGADVTVNGGFKAVESGDANGGVTRLVNNYGGTLNIGKAGSDDVTEIAVTGKGAGYVMAFENRDHIRNNTDKGYGDAITTFAGAKTAMSTVSTSPNGYSTTVQVISAGDDTSSIVNFNADETVLHNEVQQWADARFGQVLIAEGKGAEVNFNSDKTTLTSYNNYTSEPLQAKSGATLNVGGGEVTVNAISGMGAYGTYVGGSSVANITADKMTINTTVDTGRSHNASCASYNFGLYNSGSTVTVGSESELNINVSGPSMGTVGILNFGDTDIDAKKLNINVVAGRNFTYVDEKGSTREVEWNDKVANSNWMGNAYSHYCDVAGIYIGSGTFSTGPDTSTSINVDDGYKNAYGVNVDDALKVDLLGDVTITATGMQKAYALNTVAGSTVTLGGDRQNVTLIAKHAEDATAKGDSRALQNGAGTVVAEGNVVVEAIGSVSSTTTQSDVAIAVDSRNYERGNTSNTGDASTTFKGEKTSIRAEGGMGMVANAVQAVSNGAGSSVVRFSADETAILAKSEADPVNNWLQGVWAMGVIADGKGAEIVFDGEKASITSLNKGYTAQAINGASGGVVTFDGTNGLVADVNSQSNFGTTGLTGNVAIKNGATVNINTVITEDGVGVKNSTGSQANITLEEGSALNISVLGSGGWTNDSNNATGTVGVSALNGVTLDGTVDINVVAGQDYEYFDLRDGADKTVVFDKAAADAYADYSDARGLHIFGGTVQAGENSSIDITVSEGYAGAYGISAEDGRNPWGDYPIADEASKLLGDVTVDVTGKTGAYAVYAADGADITLGSEGKEVSLKAASTDGGAYSVYVDGKDTKVTVNGVSELTGDVRVVDSTGSAVINFGENGGSIAGQINSYGSFTATSDKDIFVETEGNAIMGSGTISLSADGDITLDAESRGISMDAGRTTVAAVGDVTITSQSNDAIYFAPSIAKPDVNPDTRTFVSISSETGNVIISGGADDNFGVSTRGKFDVVAEAGDIAITGQGRSAMVNYLGGVGPATSTLKAGGDVTLSADILDKNTGTHYKEAVLYTQAGTTNITAGGDIIVADTGTRATKVAINVADGGSLSLDATGKADITGNINVKGAGSSLGIEAASGSIDGRTTVEAGASATIKGDIAISGQTADNYGGAIYNKGTVELDGVSFDGNGIDNTGYAYGGAIYNEAGGKVTIANSEFTENYTKSTYKPRSGAVRNNGEMSISKTVFKGNYTQNTGETTKTDAMGGALYSGGTIDLADVTFTENKSSGEGGAISFNGAKATFSGKNTFTDNEAGKKAGAIDIQGGSTVSFSGENTFSGNKAGDLGGAISVLDSASTVNFDGTNTFSGNTDSTGANDIYSTGTVNILGGTTTMDGGIAGTGAFNNAGELKVTGGSVEGFKGTFTQTAGTTDISATDSLFGGTVSIKGGTFTADSDQVLTDNYSTFKGSFSAEAGATVKLDREELSYTRTQLTEAQNNLGEAQLIFINGNLVVDEEKESIVLGHKDGLIASGEIGIAMQGQTYLDADKVGSAIVDKMVTIVADNAPNPAFNDADALTLAADITVQGLNVGAAEKLTLAEGADVVFAATNADGLFVNATGEAKALNVAVNEGASLTLGVEGQLGDRAALFGDLNNAGTFTAADTAVTAGTIANSGTASFTGGSVTAESFSVDGGKTTLDSITGGRIREFVANAGEAVIKGVKDVLGTLGVSGSADVTLTGSTAGAATAADGVLSILADSSVASLAVSGADVTVDASEVAGSTTVSAGKLTATGAALADLAVSGGEASVSGSTAGAATAADGVLSILADSSVASLAVSGADVTVDASEVAGSTTVSAGKLTATGAALADLAVSGGEASVSGSTAGAATAADGVLSILADSSVASLAVSGADVTVDASEVAGSTTVSAGKLTATGAALADLAVSGGEASVTGSTVASLAVSGGTALLKESTLQAAALTVDGGDASLEKVTASALKTVNANDGKLTFNATDLALDDVTIVKGAVSVLDSDVTIGKLTATGGTFFVDPSTVIIKELAGNELGTALTIGTDSAVVIGGSSIEDALQHDADAEKYMAGKATLVLGKHIKLAGAGGILVDPNASASDVPAAGSATFATGSLLAADGHHFDSDEEPAIITGSNSGALTVGKNAELYISNAAANEVYTVAEGFTSYDVDESAWSQDHGTLILNGLVEGDLKAITHDDGTVEIVTSTKIKEDSAFFDAIPSSALYELAEVGGAVESADMGKQFLSRAVDPTYMSDEGQAIDAVNEVSRAAVTAGVQNTSLRIADAASNTVLDHMSLSQHDGSKAIHSDGVDFWAAPMYGNLYTSGMQVSGSSVRGQFGGLALGADLEAGQFLGGKFRLGAAINGGGGQSETKGSATSTQNDYDFGGLNFYAGWNSGALNIIGSVGYGFGNHEVEMGLPSGMKMGSAKADIDTTVFTADLRAEYQLKTDWVDVLPHAGVRYTALKTDAHDLKADGGVLNSVKSDTQNIVQFPVGVTLSKDFAFADWNVKPMFDVSVIPAAGDKKATTKVNFSGMDAWDSVNSRIMDSTSWSGTVGVQAEKGNMTFGLNYGVQASSNETDQNVQVKFGWKF